MKIDRKRPAHWIYLGLFFLQALLGLLLRRGGRRPSGKRQVILYGHKLNGNLLALYRQMRAEPAQALQPVFLTMDPEYRRQLAGQGVCSIWACGGAAARLLAEAPVLVSDHGLHALQPLMGAYQRAGMRFIDVWHGIPFKGFDAADFRLQHRYDETWVASERCRALYIDRYGFMPDRLRVTGYARTDRLVNRTEDLCVLRASLGLPPEGRLILFAPTWAQDVSGRSLYPFGESANSFLGALSAAAECHGATVLLRSHLNSGEVSEQAFPRVVALPGTRYPDTEAILLVSDILICDWSSIAFDFLLLDRPAFFLDVEPPFRKGFSLGAEFRYGAVVDSLEALGTGIRECLTAPERYWQAHGARHADIRQKVYARHADGRAAIRCVERLS